MILRSWHGAVPIQYGDSFNMHLHSTGIAEAKALPGNLGVFVKRVTQDDFEHFFLLTYWDGWESIRWFAGESLNIAVTYPEDDQFELISDPIVLHQEVTTVSPWFGDSNQGLLRSKQP
jgi:heme-degrading monooxygenase HmoA